jgi:hypothetical protein
MAKLSKKAAERIATGIKRFQPILASAKSRDVNESDTAIIVSDLLQEIFGYDKYSEITSEYQIRSTYCDLAVKLDGKLALLIEVKAIGLHLKDQYVKQAIDYAANQGVEWVVLTTGVIWQIYRVSFTKPIQHEMVVSFDLLELNPRNSAHIDMLGLLAKEGWQKARLGEYASQREALSRFVLAALVLSDSSIDVLRRELRRLSPDVRITRDEIRDALKEEVLKRDVLEGDGANAARRRVSRASERSLRQSRSEQDAPADGPDDSDLAPA